MYYKNMYKEILLVIDTCEGFTLFDNATAPNLFLVSSSLKNEKGVSYLFDPYMMTQLSDRFTFLFNSLLENNLSSRNYYYPFETLFALIARENEFLESNVGIKKTLDREVIMTCLIRYYYLISFTLIIILPLKVKVSN
jgi:glycosylphosphatidylinositol transamidase (GPIT) subunit GPI8